MYADDIEDFVHVATYAGTDTMLGNSRSVARKNHNAMTIAGQLGRAKHYHE